MDLCLTFEDRDKTIVIIAWMSLSLNLNGNTLNIMRDSRR